MDSGFMKKKTSKKLGHGGVKPLSPRNPLDRSSRSIQGMRPQNNWGEPAVVLMFFSNAWSTMEHALKKYDLQKQQQSNNYNEAT